MTNFRLLGRVVHHTARPVFTVLFITHPDGGWVSDRVVIDEDEAVKFAADLPRLMREAGEYFAAHRLTDWIQEAVIARAAEREVTAYRISQLTGGAVSEDHVKDYLERRKSMGSHKLQHVMAALGLEVKSR